MRLSTSTNLMDKVGDSFGVISPEDSVLICRKAGFEVFDYNFCDQGRPGRPVAQADWKEYLTGYRTFCEAHGITFPQTHLHMYDPVDPRIEDHGWERELLRRSVEGSGILGTKWAVAHPLRVPRAGYTHNDYLQLNLEYYGPILEQAQAMGYGLSFENMGEDKYGNCAEDLCELVDGFKLPNAGINWDFGHANLAPVNQYMELRQIGKRLKTLHVADNHGQRDEHLAPFYGNLDWHRLMQVLAEIEYEGDFTYEVQAFTNPLPRQLRETQAAHLVEIGRYLMKKFSEACDEYAV